MQLAPIVDYPTLNYLKELYQLPGVKETCNLTTSNGTTIRATPMSTLPALSPKDPLINFDAPHNRYRMGAALQV